MDLTLPSLRRYVLPLLLIASTAACGGGATGATAGDSSGAATSSITFQVRMLNVAIDGQQCLQIKGGDRGANPFHEGSDWQLQDQDGVILSRDTMSAGVPDGQYCNLPLNFENVSTSDVKMFVLRNELDNGWKFMPSEVADSPVVINFWKNPPDDV